MVWFMKKIVSLVRSGLVAGIMLFLVMGCSGGDKPEPAAKKTPSKRVEKSAETRQERKVKENIEGTETMEQPVEEIKVFRYDSRGRRDPFRSVLETAKSKQKLADLPPLQRVDLIDMKLTGIVWGAYGPSALIKTPDGKAYTVRAGALLGLNQGVILRISESAVMVREEIEDIFGVKKTRKIELVLYPQEEGKE